MGKKKSRARVQVVWVSRSHAVLKLHKSVLARLVASYHDGEGNWEADTPIPLGAIKSIMENPKLANGARFFWDHPRRRGMREPGLKPPAVQQYLETSFIHRGVYCAGCDARKGEMEWEMPCTARNWGNTRLVPTPGTNRP